MRRQPRRGRTYLSSGWSWPRLANELRSRPCVSSSRPPRAALGFAGTVFVGSLSSSDGDGWPCFHSVEFLDFAWWTVVEGFVDTLVVEPRDVLQDSEPIQREPAVGAVDWTPWLPLGSIARSNLPGKVALLLRHFTCPVGQLHPSLQVRVALRRTKTAWGLAPLRSRSHASDSSNPFGWSMDVGDLNGTRWQEHYGGVQDPDVRSRP